MKQHEYARRIFRAIDKGLLDLPIKYEYVDIKHDNDCLIFEDKHCNCDPAITIQTEKGPVKIAQDGTYEQVH